VTQTTTVTDKSAEPGRALRMLRDLRKTREMTSPQLRLGLAQVSSGRDCQVGMTRIGTQLSRVPSAERISSKWSQSRRRRPNNTGALHSRKVCEAGCVFEEGRDVKGREGKGRDERRREGERCKVRGGKGKSCGQATRRARRA
jgi:hypothetical protein